MKKPNMTSRPDQLIKTLGALFWCGKIEAFWLCGVLLKPLCALAFGFVKVRIRDIEEKGVISGAERNKRNSYNQDLGFLKFGVKQESRFLKSLRILEVKKQDFPLIFLISSKN